MQYNIKLEIAADANTLRQLIGTLDQGPHGLVRPIIDSIIKQAQEQEAAQQAAPEAPAETEAAGLTD